MSAREYEYTDVSLTEWRGMVLERYPSATIYKAPEDEGGTRSAFVDGEFVGDWDGSEAPYGRVLTTSPV